MEKLVLTEWYELTVDPQVIEEAEKASGPLILKDRLLQKSNTKNHNGRIYPAELLQREVKKFTELVNSRRALGELDHPDSPIVELNNVSHLITNIRVEGDEVRGDIEILNTPKGEILKSLISQQVKIGVSSRGVGSLNNESDAAIVQDDFELITFDAVSSPSTPGAYLVNESKIANVDKYNDLRGVLYGILGNDYFKSV